MPLGNLENFDPESDSWTNYKERLSFYFQANEIDDPEKKKALFVSVIGKSLYEIIKKLIFPSDVTRKSLEEILDSLTLYFEPKRNELCARQLFYSRNQYQNESIADYIKELKGMASSCGFINDQIPLDIMLRDRFILGIFDNQLQQDLIATPDITFQTAYNKALAKEQSQTQLKQLKNVQPLSEINKIKNDNKIDSETKLKQRKCFRCDAYNHIASNCYLKNETCNFCKKVGHIEKACMFKKKYK